MVRLKAEKGFEVHKWKKLFQFHNGTIKSSNTSSEVDASFYFNSIMVRLKVCDKCASIVFSEIFQFHNGTIKRISIQNRHKKP